jgi:hypothetical protein
MTNDRLFYFLGQCLACGYNAEAEAAVRDNIERGDVNWDGFVWMASNHLVLPGVFVRFRDRGILPLLPVDLREHLETVYRLNLRRNLAILEQTRRLNREFAASRVTPIYLKGVGNLLDHLYPDAGERISTDIDLLVSDDSFVPAARSLEASGYEPIGQYSEDQRDLTKHYPRLLHPTETAGVEIHRVPVELGVSRRFNYTSVAPHIVRVSDGPPCYVLSDRDKVVLNFLHGFMPYGARFGGRVSYRHLNDLSHLARRVDVFEVLDNVRQYRHYARVYAEFANRASCLDRTRALAPQSRLFLAMHDRCLRSRAFGRTVDEVTYLGFRLWTSYIKNLVGMCVDRRVRKTVFQRLTTPSWYAAHVMSYRRMP